MEDGIKVTTAPKPVEAEKLERIVIGLRPKLHRYCARMVGSVVEAEDVVQEALTKAVEALPRVRAIENPEAWLFRIAHNAALDFLRQRERRKVFETDEDVDMKADPVDEVFQRQAAAAALHTFMRLPVVQRSSVVLKDVLGYSLEEIGDVSGKSIPAVKAALHSGREQLRLVALEPDDLTPPVLSEAERDRLAAYVAHFNDRDFDAVRDMLAEDVQLELVSKSHMRGRSEVERYFGNYASIHDWRLDLGFVDRRPALIVRHPHDPPDKPDYFILLQWVGRQISRIRDFRHARYAMEPAEVTALD
ncbi:sigma-70 family RNA polymerase sigma factor [Bradyrhizobium diazoefficiens]|nr:sigma-70 family RNA polymerase sigma factor [Bradyrhizobium diazoefficiens]QQO21418.1 sigma-70 family RNA polymerase sigma factor [Bradyrhizobium diazoefficiens]